MSDQGRYKPVVERTGLPVAIDHDKDEETIVVGVQRHDNHNHTWELRVNGMVHAYGIADYAGSAFREAADALDARLDEVSR